MNTKHGWLLVVMITVAFGLQGCTAMGQLARHPANALYYINNRVPVIPGRVPNQMSVNGIYHTSEFDVLLAGGTYLTEVDGKTVLAAANMHGSYVLTDAIGLGPDNNRTISIPHSNGRGATAWMQQFIVPSFIPNGVVLFPVAVQNHTNRGTVVHIRSTTGSKMILGSFALRGCEEKLIMLPLDEDSPGGDGFGFDWKDQKSFFPRPIHVNRPQSPKKRGLFGNPVALIVEITEMFHAEGCTGLVP